MLLLLTLSIFICDGCKHDDLNLITNLWKCGENVDIFGMACECSQYIPYTNFQIRIIENDGCEEVKCDITNHCGWHCGCGGTCSAFQTVEIVTPAPTYSPTPKPSPKPTHSPTHKPSPKPTHSPTHKPSPKPTHSPTRRPSEHPTLYPSDAPTYHPTKAPTNDPTIPTEYPTITTQSPTYDPTISPTSIPTKQPTKMPSIAPTFVPTNNPSAYPTMNPSTSFDSTDRPLTEVTEVPELIIFLIVGGCLFLCGLLLYVACRCRKSRTAISPPLTMDYNRGQVISLISTKAVHDPFPQLPQSPKETHPYIVFSSPGTTHNSHLNETETISRATKPTISACYEHLSSNAHNIYINELISNQLERKQSVSQ
eukprot:336280_1